MITFAAFYVELAPETRARVLQSVPTVTRFDPARQHRVMFDSARRTHPGCSLVVLTDAKTRLDIGDDVETVVCDVDAAHPSQARVDAHAAYLAKTDSDVVFLDSDVLVQESLEPVFARSFDVGLTYRDLRPWPVNSGVILASSRRLDRARRFFERTSELIASRHFANRTWGGDQDALEDQVEGADVSRTDSFVHLNEGFEILMLPCDQYNFSTESDDPAAMLGPFPNKVLLHFKGRRKGAYEPYWQRLCSEDGHAAPRNGDAQVSGITGGESVRG